MARGRASSNWFRVRAALALFALFVQAAVPNIVAAEIDFAGDATDILGHCPFAQLDHDNAGDEDAPSDSERHHDHGDCGLCPICLALLASPAFLTAPDVAISVPLAHFAHRLVPRNLAAPTIAATHSYRSRAPPRV